MDSSVIFAFNRCSTSFSAGGPHAGVHVDEAAAREESANAAHLAALKPCGLLDPNLFHKSDSFFIVGSYPFAVGWKEKYADTSVAQVNIATSTPSRHVNT